MKPNWNKLIVGDCPITGPAPIDVDFLVKNWDNKCWLAEWREGKYNDFRFIRYRRLGQETTTHKFTISTTQAAELIARLNLEATKDPVFSRAYSWRTKQANND